MRSSTHHFFRNRLLVGLFLAIAAAAMGQVSGSSNVISASKSQLSDEVKAFISKARPLYHAPAEHGLKKLSCILEPDWKKFVVDVLHSDRSPNDPRVKELAETRYAVSIDEQGKISIKAFRISGGEINPDFSQIVGGVQKMLEGALDSWSEWGWENPIPSQAASIALSQKGDNYTLSVVPACSTPELHTCAAGTQIEMTLDKDYLVVDASTKEPGLNTRSFPKFTKTDKGLILTSLSIEMNRGQIKSVLDIDYQDVQGFKLPAKIVYKVPVQGDPDQPPTPIVVEAAFTKYQIN